MQISRLDLLRLVDEIAYHAESLYDAASAYDPEDDELDSEVKEMYAVELLGVRIAANSLAIKLRELSEIDSLLKAINGEPGDED